ncbi:hypothetical protein V5E97_28060 [Singulisphaera sp. Ch08]|uniref:Actin-binding WH2 domain-containing protein n=1 Tax=Singulisphaera sp. Ch08 TaxID=3120278 RepID=A0AAU7CBT4_9BACT
MRDLLSRADAVLRGRSSSYPWTLLVLCGLVYGSVMGAFGGLIWQVVYSAVKVPLLLLATLLLSLPSYLVMNTLLGVRDDIAEAVRAIAVSQATVTIVLVALAPLTVLWYASSADYHAAILFNAAMFAVASLAAQIALTRAYRPLIARSPRHRWLLWIWIVLYAFVGIQMGWTLRPFIGSPGAPVQFFRGGDLENAYVVVARMIINVWAR